MKKTPTLSLSSDTASPANDAGRAKDRLAVVGLSGRTDADLVHAYIFHHENENLLAANTIDAYKAHTMAFSRYLFAARKRRDLSRATGADITAYLDGLRKADKSLSTVQAHYMALTSFYSYMAAHSLVAASPVPKMPMTRTGSDAVPILTIDQIARLRDVVNAQMNVEDARSLRNACMIYLPLFAGLKSKEMVELKTKSIANDFREVSVTGSHTRQSRTVTAMHTDLVEALRLHLTTNFSASQLTMDLPLLATHRSVEAHMKRQTVWHATKDFGDAAGIKDLDSDMLRHTSAVLWMHGPGDYQGLSKFLGVHPISVTRYEKYMRASSYGDLTNT